MLEIITEDGMQIIIDPNSISAIMYDTVDDATKGTILLKGSPHAIELPSSTIAELVSQWNEKD